MKTNLKIRKEAIVALEQLAVSKSLNALMRQWAMEKETTVKADLIRAIASAGRGITKAESLVLKTAERNKKEFIKVHALIGLHYFENQDKAREVLLKALADPSSPVRASAA